MLRLMMAVMLCTFMALPAMALDNPLKMIPGLMQDYSTKTQSAESALKSKDMADWQQKEIDDYLYNSVFAIYYSFILYLQEYNEHPTSPEQLRNSGILSPWPGNPFNNWEPITWSPDNIDFSAGNLALQLCPPDKYSGLPPRPITFVMSIFGPTIDYTPLEAEKASPFTTMTWAIEPEGAVFNTAFYRSPSPKKPTT